MKSLDVVAVPPPPVAERVRRAAQFAAPGEKPSRYHLPRSLESCSPIGYRTRIPFTAEEADEALQLLCLDRPAAFAAGEIPSEQELFEEASLSVLSSRQSTNFRGFKQITFVGDDAKRVSALLAGMPGLEAPVLDKATHVHVILSRPYRTPFTFLLTFVGHKPVISLATTAWRALSKRFAQHDDIPTIGYLQQLHIGFLSEALERAAVIASNGKRMAQVFSFCDGRNKQLEALCQVPRGYRIALVAQVGNAPTPVSPALCRKLGANLMAFRSERIQPGVNAETVAPEAYRRRQSMNIPEALTAMAGRAAYNAFCHWTGLDREQAKSLMLLERIDVLTPEGKTRIREVRAQLERITDHIIRTLPLWADWPTGRALSKNTARGKKAFALAGQRIYIGGLSRSEVAASGLNWDRAVRAIGAAAARSSLYAEIMGVVNVPNDCDLLAGVCVMAGPVNQNDIGKAFYGEKDLLEGKFPGRDPTSLLVWTLKAKTIADPIGNEEQLMNPARKGALVDLRPGPHEVVSLYRGGRLEPMRARGNSERAFADAGNFVTDPSGARIPGN